MHQRRALEFCGTLDLL